ncbi:unnamed protein product, partial [Ectocarpus sp. 12 AP-2014]
PSRCRVRHPLQLPSSGSSPRASPCLGERGTRPGSPRDARPCPAGRVLATWIGVRVTRDDLRPHFRRWLVCTSWECFPRSSRLFLSHPISIVHQPRHYRTRHIKGLTH